MRKLKHLTKEEELDIFNEREIGEKRKDILSKWGISERHYKDIILENGGVFNNLTQKYSFNEDYFETIDSEDKAYFLGFIIADGCVSDGSNRICITQKETDILYEFKKYVGFEGPIHKQKNRNISSINLSSSKMKSDLYKLGIHSNKTMVVKYPDISKELQNHFIRGVFDGDGCISMRIDKRDNSVRGQFNICSGSYEFIEKYYNNLNKYCGLVGKNKIRCPKGTYYVVDWGGLSDIEKIHEFLYKGSTLYLDRKKKTFDEVVSITKCRKKYRK